MSAVKIDRRVGSWMLFSLCGGLLLGCSKKALVPAFAVATRHPVAEIAAIPQDAHVLSVPPGWSPPKQLDALRAQARTRYFAPWHRPTCTETREAVETRAQSILHQGFGANLLPHSEAWRQTVLANANYAAFGSICVPGVVLEPTDVRSLPTQLPSFADPQTAGEGYPFDNLQGTRAMLGVPVLISHWSLDRAWAYVETNEKINGWVPARAVTLVSGAYLPTVEALPWAVMTKDDQPVFLHGRFAFFTRLGSYLPLVREDADALWVKIPVVQGDSSAWEQVALPKHAAVSAPWEFTAPHLQQAVAALLGRPYGWGTYLNNRDCSALMHDFYALFGLWLPRNSGDQANTFGKMIPLSTKSVAEKQQMIQQQGVPFQTLLFLPGHITMYVGVWQGKPLLFHAPWGVRTRSGEKTGRNIVGTSVLSPLEYGMTVPYFDTQKGTLLQGFTGMSMLDEPVQ